MKSKRSAQPSTRAQLRLILGGLSSQDHQTDNGSTTDDEHAVTILLRPNNRPGDPKELYSFTLVTLSLSDPEQTRWQLLDRYFNAGWKPCLGDSKHHITYRTAIANIDPYQFLLEAIIDFGEDPNDSSQMGQIAKVRKFYRYEEHPAVAGVTPLSLVRS